MNIIRIDNHLHSDSKPSIKTETGEWWFLKGKLHRSKKPAVINNKTELYYWRGIRLTKSMAMGQLSSDEVFKIKNIEQRQASMEILGYLKFMKNTIILDKFTPEKFSKIYPEKSNPMYTLLEILSNNDDRNEKIKFLIMCDPSKVPTIKYAIRVKPNEINCKDSVAHSYGFSKWDDFYKNKNWV